MLDQILEEIMDETYIIIGALDENDMDIAYVAIERRKNLIEDLKATLKENGKKLPADYIAQFNILNEKCLSGMALNKLKLMKEYQDNKKLKSETINRKNVRHQYSLYNDMVKGSTFDKRK